MLQLLTKPGELRRIARGPYYRPVHNVLTVKPSVLDYRAVIVAVIRRDQARMVVDGMTSANDLGLTTAVPARIEVLVEARLKPITLGNHELTLMHPAPRRRFSVGRPAMRIGQAPPCVKGAIDQNRRRVLKGTMVCGQRISV